MMATRTFSKSLSFLSRGGRASHRPCVPIKPIELLARRAYSASLAIIRFLVALLELNAFVNAQDLPFAADGEVSHVEPAIRYDNRPFQDWSESIVKVAFDAML